jgi:histidinol-phosphate phosphatase family protein
MRVVFLDRDGVINKYPGDRDYVKSWDEFEFLPGALAALKRLTDGGFKIFVISNQAGVSKGIFSQEELDLITKNMLEGVNKAKARISGVYYCTHRPEENCPCRKPKTGLVKKAIEQLKDEGKAIDLSGSFFIGDTIKDIETGHASGLKTILVFSGKEKPENKDKWESAPQFSAPDLSKAVDLILVNK